MSCLWSRARRIATLVGYAHPPPFDPKQDDFFRWIRSANLVFEKDGDFHPVAEHRLDGRFVLKLYLLPNGRHRAQTTVTKQGLVWFTHKWKARQIVLAKEAAAARIQGELGV